MIATGTLAFSAAEARVIAAALDVTASMVKAMTDDGEAAQIHLDLKARFDALAGELR